MAENSKTVLVVHCWEDGPRDPDNSGSTCMLLYGHKGPHKFTPDDQIKVEFDG